MKRADPSGSAALIVCNFSAAAQTIPVAPAPSKWQLTLWTGDPTYGGSGAPSPVEELVAGSSSEVHLSAFETAVYLT
jgi:hypothetical protein